MEKNSLRLDWCSHAAAKYAVEHWHYSQRMPTGKLNKVGVWEGGEFIGVVLFGRGANNNLSAAFGLRQTDICELVRVALRVHSSSVTRIIAIALRMLKRRNENLRLVVSYADPAREHKGAIYQAGNWVFDGQQQGQTEYIVRGKQKHGRSCTATLGTTVGLPKVSVPGKYRYLMPLDAEMRERIKPLAKPYPKRERSSDSGTTVPTEGGAAMRPARSNMQINFGKLKEPTG